MVGETDDHSSPQNDELMYRPMGHRSRYRPWKPMTSDRKAGAAAAGRGGIGVDHAERGADQVVDEINLGARQKRHRGGIDQHHRIVALNHQVILGLRALDVELVLKAGAAAALDADAQHRTLALGLEDLPDTAGPPLAGDHPGWCHYLAPITRIYPNHLVSG